MKEIKVKRRVHNRLFTNRKISFLLQTKYCVDFENDTGEIEYFISTIGKVILTIGIVPIILFNGIMRYKETVSEYFKYMSNKSVSGDNFTPSRYEYFGTYKLEYLCIKLIEEAKKYETIKCSTRSNSN